MKNKDITFIDLFCGIGGIRLGMETSSFKCIMSCDNNEDCRRTYIENFNDIPLKDITEISNDNIPGHDILCAGFPCQPFSISGKQKGFEDTRGTLFFEICRILAEKKPEIVFLENVKNLIYHDHGNTFKVIVKNLEELGYALSWRVLNASDFGAPQNRERIIIIGSLREKFGDKKFDFDKVKTIPRQNIRLADFLDTDGNFKYLDEDEYTLIKNPKKQPSGLIFAGYRNKNLRKTGVRPDTENLSRTHRQVNRIYSVEGIHPTISSQETSGRYFILTEENKVRKLTLNECWRIMGFPDDYKKIGVASTQYRQIGNSVCIPMVTEIAKEIKNQFYD